MAIDWNSFFALKVDELNEEKVEVLYQQLIEFSSKNETNVERLRQLFEVCKSVMQIKSLQAEVAVEELEETTKNYNKNEIDLLKKELEMYKASDIKGENIGLKLSQTTNQIIELKNTIESKDSENIKLKRKLNDLENNLELRDKEVGSLRSEVDSLRDEMYNQRQTDDQYVEREEPLEKLREKNKQIQTLLNELREVETINLEFANQVKKLKIELNSATNELQLSANQMEMLSKQMNELKQLNEDFISEKQYLTEEINKLKDSLNAYEGNGNENIIDKYIENIKDLQNLITTKDEEIIKLKSLGLIPDENVRKKQKKMLKELEEKNKQIDLLKSQLNEAIVDIESQTEIIQKLSQQNKGDEELTKLYQKVSSLTNQLKAIEEEVLAKDEELLSLRKRINTYERGEYGLRDALKEVNDLTKHLNNRDHRIEEIIEQLNQLKGELNEAEDAIDVLKDDNNDNVKNDKMTENIEIKTTRKTKLNRKDKIKMLELEQHVIQLEDEKIALTERLRHNINKTIANNKSEEYKEINLLKDRLKSVETENCELQLGMKEILNGIRESDSQSDVIIECPSLERLCRLMESRTISADLTNIIALKAELDLVRGHNEQIRTDMRQLRNDYLKVISQYTQHLLDNDMPFSESQTEYSKDINLNQIQTIQLIDDKEDENRDAIKILDNNISNEETINLLKIKQKNSMNKETQTLELNDTKMSVIEPKIAIQYSHVFTQTEIYNDIQSNQKVDVIESNLTKSLCENCAKVMKIVYFLKNCVEKLEENIKSSENKFGQRLKLLQNENKNLTESMNKKLNEKDLQLIEKEEQINYLQNRITNHELLPSMPELVPQESSVSEDQTLLKNYSNKLRFESQPQLSSSCKNVLESVINCLQARLDHKDESIRQYRNMLSESKQNFENEMIRLIEANTENDDKNSINFTQMIDNEELQSALKSCLNELELCKTELNAKINQLEEELERKNAKLLAFQNENEDLKTRRMNPNTQLKQTIEELREECQQKDLLIQTLKKNIKDDRAMRAVSAVKRVPKDDSIKSNRKVDNELFQEIADLRAMTETQKQTIKHLEVVKWDYEKNLKELKEQLKLKLKDKEKEISDLKEKVDKIKIRLTKNENEKQLLQNKVTVREKTQQNRQHKVTQTSCAYSEQELTKLKQELKTLRNDVKERESEANVLKNELEMNGQKERELKTLLEESVKREKLATIHEKSTECDQQYDQLLQENARIKVELRMAEFELNRRSQQTVN